MLPFPFQFGGFGRALPNSGDPYFANVSLLLHMDGSNGSTTFIDSSSPPKTITATADAKISTAQSKFGGASAIFDGAGDYLTVSTTADALVTTGDITIEFFSYISTLGNGSFYGNFSSNSTGHSALMYYTDGSIRWYYNGNSNIVSAAGKLVAGTWQHIALVKQQGSPATFTIYVNGVSVATTTLTQATFGASAVAFRIGNPVFSSETMNGYIDDFRVTKGIARYTANFTPPAAVFPNN